MNCDNYLSMLATLPVEELAYGSARDHAANCRECDRVTRVVAERERNMLVAFGAVHPYAPAGQVAERALVSSRRRTVALYSRIALGVMTVATILSVILSRRVPAPSANAGISETFRLQCLSPEQAAEVIRPVVPASGRISYRRSSALGIIKVEVSPEEMQRVRAMLDRYDTPTASQCGVKLTVPKTLKEP